MMYPNEFCKNIYVIFQYYKNSCTNILSLKFGQTLLFSWLYYPSLYPWIEDILFKNISLFSVYIADTYPQTVELHGQ